MKSLEEGVDLPGDVGFVVLEAAGDGVAVPADERRDAPDLEQGVNPPRVNWGPPRRPVSDEGPQQGHLVGRSR